MSDLYKQLTQLIKSRPGSRNPPLEDEAEDPKAQPIVWVSKWVDYSDKYGFGYSLNDDSIGVVFNDLTKLLLLADGLNIHYIDYDGNEVRTSWAKLSHSYVKLIRSFDRLSDLKGLD